MPKSPAGKILPVENGLKSPKSPQKQSKITFSQNQNDCGPENILNNPKTQGKNTDAYVSKQGSSFYPCDVESVIVVALLMHNAAKFMARQTHAVE